MAARQRQPPLIRFIKKQRLYKAMRKRKQKELSQASIVAHMNTTIISKTPDSHRMRKDQHDRTKRKRTIKIKGLALRQVTNKRPRKKRKRVRFNV